MATKYYTKLELLKTPSAADGINFITETKYRQDGARFIFNLGRRLKLSHDTISSAIIYFHRFYMVYSFSAFSRYVTACGCLLLAGKVEETPKKCKDLIDVTRELLTTEEFADFGNDPKKEITTLEKILLQTLKFKFEVTNPYNCLLKYAKCLKGDTAILNSLVQAAWTFINDSLCSTMCLQWEPEIIAVATIYMACLICKFKVSHWIGQKKKHKNWWDMYVEGLTYDFLEGIRKDILGLYDENKIEKINCKMDSKSSTSSNTPQTSPGQPFPSNLKSSHSKPQNPVSLKNSTTPEVNGIPSNGSTPPIPKPAETSDIAASTPGEEGHTPPGPPPPRKRKSPKTPPLPENDDSTNQSTDPVTFVYAPPTSVVPTAYMTPNVEYMASHPPPMGYPYMYMPTPGVPYPYPYYGAPTPQPQAHPHHHPPQPHPDQLANQCHPPPRWPMHNKPRPPFHPQQNNPRNIRPMRPMRPPRLSPYGGPPHPMVHPPHHPGPFWRPELYS